MSKKKRRTPAGRHGAPPPRDETPPDDVCEQADPRGDAPAAEAAPPQAPDAGEAPTTVGDTAADREQRPADPLAQLQAERDGLFARLQRVSADYQNYQKRVRRDLAQGREFAQEELMKALLPILDDMERALEAGRATHDADDPLLTGMQLAHDNALSVLSKFGLERIEAVGQPFDPDLHSAIMQQATDEQEPQTVLAEVQKGYRFKGRAIRPSRVVVAVPISEDGGGEDDEPTP